MKPRVLHVLYRPFVAAAPALDHWLDFLNRQLAPPQELVLAGWLIAKGFDTSAIAAEPVVRGVDLPHAAVPSVAADAS